MSETTDSVADQHTPTHRATTPTHKPPLTVLTDGGGAGPDQISFRPGMQSFPRGPIGDHRSSMGEYPLNRERRTSGPSTGMSTPDHKFQRRTPFQMEYSSRRSLNGSTGAASSFGPLFTPAGMTRSASVASNGSMDRFPIENRVGLLGFMQLTGLVMHMWLSYSVSWNKDLPLPDDPDELKQKIKDNWQAQDNLRMELSCKREEIVQLRQKVMDLKTELAAVNTSKGVLNEACVTGMMDVFALNSHITKLQSEKEALEVAAEQMRRETEDHDQERRGLLNLLEEKKTAFEQCEELLKAETNRRKEVEQSRAGVMERMDLELKWVQRQLSEKTIRLKKLAKANEKLARKLLALEADNVDTKGIAKQLQKHNQQLNGDNQDLNGCVMQMEHQIGQLAAEKDEVQKSMEVMREEHSQRLEGERTSLLSKMEKLEKDLDTVRQKRADSDASTAKTHNEQISWLEQEKSKMEGRVKSLSVGIESLKEEQKLQEEIVAQMRREYVKKLEEDTQTLRSRIKDLERQLDDARASESQSSTAHKQTKAQMQHLEEEKLALDAQVKSLEAQIGDLQGEVEAQTDADKRIKAQEALDLLEEKEDLQCQLDVVEKQLRDVKSQKLSSDELVRKLRQEIRDFEQQKSSLTHQVNVLEWHLSGLYAEKQEALRALEDRNLELIRLQQDLADKEEDLERVKQENITASESVVVRTRELKVSSTERESQYVKIRQRNKELEAENERLLNELDEIRKKPVQPKIEVQEKKARHHSFLNFSLEFKF